ncbi:hypothetical protein GCK72_019534 [Caenorhabditis remanei]|uniref:F-box domain-containing protein n=1 Tax=Caenorhabditis remanei TaxID=31234 RepID=A0A6A5GEW6_CAERE|nr:hypothetical protein GCK72_019534 [Caenorhabditis remanei]KAF1752979.1 hypothetical protein GCK72_019534 [Caenorhabditis remanei]
MKPISLSDIPTTYESTESGLSSEYSSEFSSGEVISIPSLEASSDLPAAAPQVPVVPKPVEKPLKQFKFWKDLPPQFQKDVVKKLDYKARCCLRKSSTANRDLVDNCPLPMSYITIKTDRTYNPKTKQLDEQVVFSVFADNWKSVNLHGVDDFLSLFKNRRSVAQSCWFDCFDENKPCVASFMTELEKEIKIRGAQSKIRARKIQWNNNYKISLPKGNISNQKISSSPDPGIHFTNILNCFDSKYLKSLDLVKSNFTSSTINILAKSSHWWLLKEINLELQQKTMIDLFLTAERLLYTTQTFNGQDIWKVIQSFQSRDLPRGAHFQLTAHKPWDVDEVLKSFQVPVKDEPVESRRSPFIKHTQRLTTRSGELVLVVKLNSEVVRGVICRANCIKEDFGSDS